MSGAGEREPKYGPGGIGTEPVTEPVEAMLRRGRALRQQGDIRGAEAALRRALTTDPTLPESHLELGRLLQADGRWNEAAALFSRALRLIDPRLQDAANALQHLSDNANAEDVGRRADRARDARDWPEAARNYRLALERDPANSGLWVQYGHMVKEQGNYLEAEVAYRRALTLAPAVADTHLQLGGLLMLRGRRTQAVESLRTALRLDPKLEPARRSLDAALGHSPAEIELTTGALPRSPAERYGAAFTAASRKTGAGPDVIWLGVVDWHYRMQRPQHLAMGLADIGARVFYISLAFETADANGRFRILGSPHPGVFETRLRLCGDAGESVFRGLTQSAIEELHEALAELVAMTGIRGPVVVVEQPGWYDLACGLSGATLVYDCLDLATGFSGTASSLAEAEERLLAEADLVVTTSRPLAEFVAQRRSSVIIRNAAEFEHFAAGFTERPTGKRPVIGYFGALADWFEFEWIERAAAEHPDWQFRLIGRSDAGDAARLASLANVELLGELPYRELPARLAEFDIAIIPFKRNELTECTNPVKLYEYMAAGKPVVASPLPEIGEATELVYLAPDAAAFGRQIAEALAEDSPALRARRRDWARQHTWAQRARDLAQATEQTYPPISVVIRTGGDGGNAAAAVSAVRRWSDHPELEIILVDPGSSEQTLEGLRQLERADSRIRLLQQDDGGVAAGSNIGLRAASGEFIVLLSPEASVTRGWVRDLTRPMRLDPRIGLCGPLTNIGDNHQFVPVTYRSLEEMPDWAARFVRTGRRRRIAVSALDFFCVAIARRVLADVGLLDETYGSGWFAAEDYCRRASEADYQLAVVPDVFVHCGPAPSDLRLAAGDPAQVRRDRALFERRWGPFRDRNA